MKFGVTIFSGIFLCLAGCDQPTPSSEVEAAAEPTMVPEVDDPASFAKAMAALKAEPKIKDVLHQPDQAVPWMVGVLDDGNLRNGYASYLCEVLAENGIKREGLVVRVVDIAKVAQGGVPGRSTSLGSMRCDTYQPFDQL